MLIAVAMLIAAAVSTDVAYLFAAVAGTALAVAFVTVQFLFVEKCYFAEMFVEPNLFD